MQNSVKYFKKCCKTGKILILRDGNRREVEGIRDFILFNFILVSFSLI